MADNPTKEAILKLLTASDEAAAREIMRKDRLLKTWLEEDEKKEGDFNLKNFKAYVKNKAIDQRLLSEDDFNFAVSASIDYSPLNTKELFELFYSTALSEKFCSVIFGTAAQVFNPDHLTYQEDNHSSSACYTYAENKTTTITQKKDADNLLQIKSSGFADNIAALFLQFKLCADQSPDQNEKFYFVIHSPKWDALSEEQQEKEISKYKKQFLRGCEERIHIVTGNKASAQQLYLQKISGKKRLEYKRIFEKALYFEEPSRFISQVNNISKEAHDNGELLASVIEESSRYSLSKADKTHWITNLKTLIFDNEEYAASTIGCLSGGNKFLPDLLCYAFSHQKSSIVKTILEKKDLTANVFFAAVDQFDRGNVNAKIDDIYQLVTAILNTKRIDLKKKDQLLTHLLKKQPHFTESKHFTNLYEQILNIGNQNENSIEEKTKITADNKTEMRIKTNLFSLVLAAHAEKAEAFGHNTEGIKQASLILKAITEYLIVLESRMIAKTSPHRYSDISTLFQTISNSLFDDNSLNETLSSQRQRIIEGGDSGALSVCLMRNTPG